MKFSIESKNFLSYILEKIKLSLCILKTKDFVWRNADNLRGKLIKRNGVIDFMDFTPSCLSLVAVVSYKMKQIFEHLNVSKDEYCPRKYLSKVMLKSSIFYLSP